MTQKRKDRVTATPAGPVAAATAPETAPASQGEAAPEAAAGKIPMFWRVFGGAAVAVVAVVAVTVYQQMQSQITRQRKELAELNKDLRKEMAGLGGSYAGMIKKEDHNNRLRTVWDTVKELRADRSDLTTMKERCAVLIEVYKAGEEERRALAAEVRRLREAKAGSEERDQLVREIRALRERIAHLENPALKTRATQEGHAEEQEHR